MEMLTHVCGGFLYEDQMYFKNIFSRVIIGCTFVKDKLICRLEIFP